MTDKLEYLRRRAEKCVTHYYGACDCREYRRAVLEAENERLSAENAELRARGQRLTAQLKETNIDKMDWQEHFQEANARLTSTQARLTEATALLQTDADLVAGLVEALEQVDMLAKDARGGTPYETDAVLYEIDPIIDAALAAGRKRIAGETVRQSGDGTQV